MKEKEEINTMIFNQLEDDLESSKYKFASDIATARIRNIVTEAQMITSSIPLSTSSGIINALKLPDGIYDAQNKLDNTISELKNELRKKSKELTDAKDEKDKEAKLLQENNKLINNLQLKMNLNHLLSRVNEKAQSKLLADSEFVKKFDPNTKCKSVVMSIDIRDSTQLMLNAKTPEAYSEFITILSRGLFEIVTSNYGVYDKFTGDGVLCFFPDFYSGKSSIYFSLKTANESHKFFKEMYHDSYKYFSAVRSDVGLGIGMDYGDTCLTSISGDITVVGSPVVYACRLSAAPAGHTYLNQTAFEELYKLYNPYYSVIETNISFKNQGEMVAYDVSFNQEAITPLLPEWENGNVIE
jgi:class 3 adenylate cyclase